jgi:DNA-binding CsgD family transcriptional regulator
MLGLRVPALAGRDAERVLQLVAEAASVGGDDPFPSEVLERLGDLVPAKYVTYCELDHVRRRVVKERPRPGDFAESEYDDYDEALFWDVVIHENPVCARLQRGYFNAQKISDFMTQREFHRTQTYSVWLRPYGVEDQLSIGLPSPLWHTKTFSFDRGRRDFSERDRAVLDALQPHLSQMWQAARRRRRLRAALDALERAFDDDSNGVVLLDPPDRVDYASVGARRLLDRFFGGQRGGLLPMELSQWLATGVPRVFWCERSGRRLTVELAEDTLLLEETPEASLTARERQVLAWVACGKRNAEVAELLSLAPSTVRKHLENVYAKLGVQTRSGAVARFLDLPETQPLQE